jgi:hypothetical protein
MKGKDPWVRCGDSQGPVHELSGLFVHGGDHVDPGREKERKTEREREGERERGREGGGEREIVR